MHKRFHIPAFSSRTRGRHAAAALALAGGLFSVAAHAEILTTWEFPENRAAWEEDAAADTNVVAVLSARRMLDGTGTFVLFRNVDETVEASSPGRVGTGASGTFIEDSVLAGFSMVRALGGGGRRGGGGVNFTAEDHASSYDPTGSWGVENVFGAGFGEWVTVGPTPNRSFQDNKFAVTGIPGGGSTLAAARAFEGEVQLDSGTFSVSAEHGFTEKFSGFSVYGDNGVDKYQELLRWGITTGTDSEGYEDVTGFVIGQISETGSLNYQFFGEYFNLQDKSASSLPVEYEVTWQSYDGGLEFQVSATYGGTAYSPDDWIRIANASAVTAVGVLTDANSSTQVLKFDGVSVSGHVVPEPGTAALFFLGAAALAARRRKQRA